MPLLPTIKPDSQLRKKLKRTALQGRCQRKEVAAVPLADAFAATFVWAVVLLALAWVPAMALALWKRRPAAAPSAAEHAVVVE